MLMSHRNKARIGLPSCCDDDDIHRTPGWRKKGRRVAKHRENQMWRREEGW